VVNLVEEGMHVAVRIAQIEDSSLVAIPVGQVRRVVCTTVRYLRRHGVLQVPTDVRDHICARHVGLAPRGEWHFRIGKRRVAVPITSVVPCSDIDSAVNACIEGLGLGMFVSYMMAPHRKSGRLKYVLEQFETEPMPVQVVVLQGRLLSNTVRAFVDKSVGKLRRQKFD
jgi:DNA-binding transcriptional LysR family regulator